MFTVKAKDVVYTQLDEAGKNEAIAKLEAAPSLRNHIEVKRHKR